MPKENTKSILWRLWHTIDYAKWAASNASMFKNGEIMRLRDAAYAAEAALAPVKDEMLKAVRNLPLGKDWYEGTPGPWSPWIEGEPDPFHPGQTCWGGSAFVAGPDGWQIPDSAPNIRLMATAPELRDALALLLGVVTKNRSTYGAEMWGIITTARDVLERADRKKNSAA